MTMLDTVLDGPSLRQERRLITEVAGPRLRELAAPRADALPAGWSGGAPVYTVAAGGGIPVDVDGNSFQGIYVVHSDDKGHNAQREPLCLLYYRHNKGSAAHYYSRLLATS